MTLLGKIFTGLIVMMSVLFLGLAISVFATHVNWRKLVNDPNTGLKTKLAKQEEINRQLREREADLIAAINLEQMARRHALAALQTKLTARSDELARVQQELQKQTATAGTSASALVTAQSELTAITAEVKTLRDLVQAAEKDADEKFGQAVAATDQLNQMRRSLADQMSRQKPLVDQVAALKNAMDKLGVRVDLGADGNVRTDVDRLAPNVKGEVVDVGEKDLIEISIGGDDGILIGHTLDVYRAGAYLGKVIVVKTSDDRAVAEIITGYKRGTIRKGDRVATKFS